MAMAAIIKALAARNKSKSADLSQNQDLMDELGYSKPAEAQAAPAATPAPAVKAPATFPGEGLIRSLSKAVGKRKTKPAVVDPTYGATRG